MKEAKQGAIMHDGQTLSGFHYIGLLACYLIKNKNVVDEKPCVTEVPVFTLSKIDARNQQDTGTTSITLEVEERSSSFTSEIHAEHFKKVFRDTYGLTLVNWAKSSIAENPT